MVIGRAETNPLKISPQYYAVRIDDDRVPVLEYRLKPGQKEPTQSHPRGFVYMLADACARASLPDGSASVIEGHAGGLTLRGRLHAYQNVGNTDVHAIGVELKPCARK